MFPIDCSDSASCPFVRCFADIRTLGGRLGGYKQIERVELLPYHTLGVHKYEAMGKEYKLSDVRENTPEQLDRAAALLREYFANVVVN